MAGSELMLQLICKIEYDYLMMTMHTQLEQPQMKSVILPQIHIRLNKQRMITQH